MVKKRRQREKIKQNPPKPKPILIHNQFHQQTVAPLEKAYNLAMQQQNYLEAGQIYQQLQQALTEHRRLIAQKKKIRLK